MPPKQYDFSAFDKPVTQIEKESPKYDFSAFDEKKPTTLSEQTEEVGLTPIGEKDIQKFEQLKAPAAGYVAGKAAQKGLEKTGELVSKLPEKLATSLGGLTPEQVSYMQQNYKNIEAGKGISQEAVEEGYSKLENVFKQKNIQANRARELAESNLEVPLTKELMEKAASQALPKVMDKIEPEKEAFQKTLKERTQTKVESEITRLTNLIEQKKQAVIDASEYAQSKAEKAAEIAVKKATPKKKLGLVKETPIDTEAIYNKAFEEELTKSLPEQNKMQAKAIKDFQDYNNQILDLQNEYYQSSDVMPKVQEELIKEKQTDLAKKYPSVKGYEDVKNLGQDIENLTKPYSEITQLEKSRAAEELRNIRKKAFGKTPEVKDEAAKVFAEEVRQLMAPEGSASDVEYKRVSNLLNQLKQAQTEGFITRKTGEVIPGNMDMGEEDLLISKFRPESVEIGQKEQQFISKVVNPSKSDLQNIDIVRGRETFQNLVDNPKLVDEVRQAAIKQGLLDPKKAFKFGPIDAFRLTIAGGSAATGLGLFPSLVAGAYEGVKYAKTPQGAYKLATLAPRIAESTAGKITGKIAKGALKTLPMFGAGIGGVAAQAAEEALSPEPSGALPTEVETEDRRNAPIPANQQELDRIKSTYWFEKGYTPEEQQQKARLASFKEGLPQDILNKMPSPYEKPEVKAYKEKVMQSEKLGALAPTYVEAPLKKVLKSDNPAEIASIAQSMQASPDKASQEYSRVLNQIVDAPASQKEAVLFGLNQQPAFRELVRKIKGEEE
jgi:hypothetical protein